MCGPRYGLVAMLFAALPGCGSGQGEDVKATPAVPFSTSIDPGKKVGELGAADLEKLCQAKLRFRAGNQSFLRSYCKVVGITAASFSGPKDDAEARAACHAGYDQCLAVKGNGDKLVLGPEPGCLSPRAECTATVGEIETCADATPAFMEGVAATWPDCDRITVAEVKRDDPSSWPARPASCASIFAMAGACSAALPTYPF
jgi:hypothetical protein